jgi:hypothetical protein
MAPLPEAAATRGDASSTNTASVYSCSASQTDVRHSQGQRPRAKHERCAKKGEKSHFVTFSAPFSARPFLSVCVAAALSLYTISKLRHL